MIYSVKKLWKEQASCEQIMLESGIMKIREKQNQKTGIPTASYAFSETS